MNKKFLLLLAATVISTGMISDILPAEARELETANGAIIRQLPLNNTMELQKIEKENISKNYTYSDKLLDKIKYYEKTLNTKLSDEHFSQIINYIKESDDEIQKEEDIIKLKKYLYSLIYQEPYNPRFLYKKAIFEMNFGNMSEAEKCIRKAILLDKNNPVYLYELGKIELNNNQFENSIKIMESLKTQYPRETDYRIGLAQAYTQAGKYNDAIREYRVAMNFEPQNNDTIVALNELVQYSYMTTGQQFYDPMKHVQAQPAQNSKMVSYSPIKSDIKTDEENIIKTADKITADNYQSKIKPVSVQNNSYVLKNNNKPQKVNQSNKRVMVSYVNGRKVVKIVNINSEADTAQAIKEASETFENQLSETNTNYDYDSEDIISSEQKTYTKPIAQTSKSEKLVQTSAPKYQTNNDYMETDEIASNGDPNVKALTYNQPTGRKQILVTYENGKKVIKTIAPDGTPMSEYKQAKNQEKLEQKQAKEEAKRLAKEQKKNQKAASKNQANNSSQDNTTLYIQGNEYMQQQQYQAAIDVFEKVQPATLRSLTAIAACYNALQQIDTAIEYYKKAEKLSTSEIEKTQIYYSIAYLYYSKQDVEMANKYVNLSLEANPSNEHSLQLKQAISQNSTTESVNNAVSYMNQGKYTDAKRILEKSLQSNPNDFQAYYYLGHVYYATQKYEDSVRSFSMAIKYNPNYALSYYSIGLALDKLKEFNKSVAAYQQFVDMELDDNKYTQYAKSRITTIKSKQ